MCHITLALIFIDSDNTLHHIKGSWGGGGGKLRVLEGRGSDFYNFYGLTCHMALRQKWPDKMTFSK